MEGTFHRRELQAPAVSFSSTQGKLYFKQALDCGMTEGYFHLAEHYITQGHPAFCGLGSLTMALNSLLIDPKRTWQGVWRWFDESFLSCCEPLDVIKLKGITMSKLACLARCNGANPIIKYASETTVEAFRADVKRVCSLMHSNGTFCNQTVMIASYSRPVLNQTGSGHFSPIGAYNSENDMVLILDVARFKYPAHWVPLPLLFQAMQSIDSDSQKSRGYILLTASTELIASCGELCSESNYVTSFSCSGDGGGSSCSTEISTTSNADNISSPDVKHDADAAQAMIKSLTEHKCPHCN